MKNMWVSLAVMVSVVAVSATIAVSVYIPVKISENKFDAAVEAGLQQAPRHGQSGLMWVK